LTLTQTRPLTYLTFWVNFQLGAATHLDTRRHLLLHIGAVLLAYQCFERLLGGNAA